MRKSDGKVKVAVKSEKTEAGVTKSEKKSHLQRDEHEEEVTGDVHLELQLAAALGGERSVLEQPARGLLQAHASVNIAKAADARLIDRLRRGLTSSSARWTYS